MPGDTNGLTDIFVRDLQRGTTQRVNVSSAGRQASRTSLSPSISADGSTVAFDSEAANLVPGDTNRASDLFVRDLKTGTTTRESVSSAGAQSGVVNHSVSSRPPSLSGDGRYVAFGSGAGDLAPRDALRSDDVFLRDRLRGTTVLVSRAVLAPSAEPEPYDVDPVLSADGGYVAYSSARSGIVAGDTNGTADVFVFDVARGRTHLISVARDGGPAAGDSFRPVLSRDGRFRGFGSTAPDLVTGDTNDAADAFVRDRGTP